MKSTMLTSIILCFTLGVQAQSFTLQEATMHALKHNEQLKQAELDVLISEAKVRETTAIGLPQLNGEATANYFIDIPTQVAPPFDLGIPGFPTPDPNDLQEFQFGLPYSATAGITANQLLFDGSYFVGLKASKAYLNYARLAREKSEIEVKQGLAQTYFAVVSLAKTAETLKKNKTALETSAAEVKAMFEVGFVEEQDYDQVRLSIANITYQLVVIERRREQMEQYLKLQMGMPFDQNITLTDDFETLMESVAQTALDPIFNIENHIDFRTVAQGEQLSELSLAAQKTKNLPQLAAFFTHSQNGFSRQLDELFTNEFYPTTIAGLQLNVPIFSSGMRYYQTKQAKLELEKTQSQKKMLTQSLQNQAFTAKQNFNSALENMKIAEDNLGLAETIRSKTEIKYKEGLASSLDYAQAESQYLNTLNAYISTSQELFNAKLALDQALGN